MSVKFSQILETHAKLSRAVRGALQAINEKLIGDNYRLTEWPVERPGCLYATSVTLERTCDASEAGECRFTIDWRGDVYFDADDAPLCACAPKQAECEALLADFVARRARQEKGRRAA